MPPRKPRSQAERLSHLVRASDMYLHGYWQHEIAAELGVSRRTVGYDLKKLHKLWEEKAITSHDKMMQQALGRIDWLERQAYDQWQLSLKGSPTATTSSFVQDENGEPLPSRAVMREIEDEGRGDITWWNAIARCADMRIRILERGVPLRMEIGEPGEDWDAAARQNQAEWDDESQQPVEFIEGTFEDAKDNGHQN